MSRQHEARRYVVQRFVSHEAGVDHWADVADAEALDPGTALALAATGNPNHRLEATTYRVCEHALAVNVSINLEAVKS